jgi:hypothetical protein
VPDGASRRKKDLKDMGKKELIAHCTTIAKKLARKQLAIEDLKKKKGIQMRDCADCEAKNIQWNDLISEHNLERGDAENARDKLMEDQEERNAKNAEDLKKLEDKIVKLENEAKIEEVKMKALSDNLGKAEDEVKFYKGRLFPDHTPAHGATHAASVSMAGGGGNRVPSPAAFFTSPLQ